MPQFYDVSIEELREVTQEDWDLLWGRVAEKMQEIQRLRAIIRVNLLRHVPGATHDAIDALLKPRADI